MRIRDFLKRISKLRLLLNKSLSMTHTIAYYESDKSGDLRLMTLMNLLQDTAQMHINKQGCGNKISTIRSNNKNMVFTKLENLAKLYGFRFTPGLKDRVIYKELFLDGLTVLDLNHTELHRRMTLSHLAAKMELNTLAEFIFP